MECVRCCRDSPLSCNGMRALLPRLAIILKWYACVVAETHHCLVMYVCVVAETHHYLIMECMRCCRDSLLSYNGMHALLLRCKLLEAAKCLWPAGHCLSLVLDSGQTVQPRLCQTHSDRSATSI